MKKKNSESQVLSPTARKQHGHGARVYRATDCLCETSVNKYMFLCYTHNIHTAQSPSASHQGLQPIQRSQLPNPLQMGPDKQDKRERKARDFAVAPGKQLLFHPLYTLAFLLQRLDVTVKDSGPFLWRSLVNLYDHFPRTRFPFMFYTIQYKFSHCSARSGFLNLIFFF